MKKFYLLVIVLFVGTSASAQFIRHVKGIKAIDVSGGVSKYGTMAGLSYVNYFKGNLYGKVQVFGEKGEDSSIGYQSFGMDVKALRTIFKGGQVFYFNALLGTTFSYDKAIQEVQVFDIKNTLKYGVTYGFESELFLSNKFVFIISFDQRYLLSDAFGRTRYFAQAGLRINL
jgi:hypothetical protein